MGYNLLTNGVYWGYNPLTGHLQTSGDIQAYLISPLHFVKQDICMALASCIVTLTERTWRHGLVNVLDHHGCKQRSLLAINSGDEEHRSIPTNYPP